MNAGHSLRMLLREATRKPHLRLHGHPGFAGAARGEIAMDDYASLMARLFGFHRAFEEAMDRASQMVAIGVDLAKRRRSLLIERDLISLGFDQGRIDRLPLCAGLRLPEDEASALVALYVVEGSTLGGAQIAVKLARVACYSRRFFLGYGDDNNRMWRAFLIRLERSPDAISTVAAARETFEAFEIWMRDWRAGEITARTPRPNFIPSSTARPGA
jgi:heme oxygenase